MSIEHGGKSFEFQSKIETPELEPERELSEVVRVFVLQSESADEIKKRLDEAVASGASIDSFISNLSLTHSLWLEKGVGARNEGQVQPIGGNVEPEDQGSYLKTGTRELLQETHLRPTEIDELRTLDDKNEPIIISYNHDLKENGEVKKHLKKELRLFVARIAPSDTPVPQEPEEDKINRFPKLNIDDKARLWAEKKINKGGDIVLQDTLQMFPENVDNNRLKIEFPDPEKHALAVAETLRSLGAVARGVEVEKMHDVAAELVDIVRWKVNEFDAEETEQLKNDLEELKKMGDYLPEAKVVYSRIITLCGKYIDLMEWFPHAVERSNFKEEMENPGNSDIEAAVRLAFLLTKTGLSLKEVDELQKKNLESKGRTAIDNEYYDLIGFLKKILSNASDQDLSDESLAAYAKEKPTRELEKDLQKSTGIKSFRPKAETLNKFLEEMISASFLAGSQDKLHSNQVSQISEVSSADFASLLTYAFDTENPEVVKHFQLPELREKLKFEALRKLFLLSALEPAVRRYAEVVELGKQEIERVWSKLLVFDTRGGELSRAFKEIPGLIASQEVRTKQVGSYFRKIIVRGFDDPKRLWDIYGRVLVLEPDRTVDETVSQELFTRVADTVQVYVESEDNKLIPTTKTVFEFPAVLKIIEKLTENGAKIVDYDPTNLPGTSFSSSGPGGGDKIVLAKFYVALEVEGENGLETQFEEVQIFSPTEDGVSGAEHKKRKGDADNKYAVKRLTDTKGLRSFIELMFPAAVYGDPMHEIYRKKNVNGHK